ncbi:hypothetical protein CEXT_54351 [Caerostris extrusa]|uniref:Uncharacterized protein n=1 Tax=Caerostris extrusa TaxID=172846 RepID=A0AAV4WPM1_CAEEX|nr:hypothetical protein CEXT_54351 [Caerostris extrusa]
MGSTADAVFRRDELCTNATIILDSNPLVGSLQTLFSENRITQLCNYYLRFESSCGFYCSRCFKKCSDYACVKVLSEIRNHLWALLQSQFSDVTRLCNYYLRLESTYSIAAAVLRNLDYARMQLLSGIRIHLWALLQSLFSSMTRLCNYYLRFESTLWALLQSLFSNMTRLCNYNLRLESTCGFYCRRCFLKIGLCTYATII